MRLLFLGCFNFLEDKAFVSLGSYASYLGGLLGSEHTLEVCLWFRRLEFPIAAVPYFRDSNFSRLLTVCIRLEAALFMGILDIYDICAGESNADIGSLTFFGDFYFIDDKTELEVA